MFDEIKELANEVVDAYDVAESLADAYESVQREQQELLQRNICKAKNRLDTLERMTTKAYEDLLTETITEPMFNSLVERAKKESEDLRKQIARLTSYELTIQVSFSGLGRLFFFSHSKPML